MSNSKIIEDIFGEDLARKVTKRNEYRWTSIQRALTTSYEDWELEVPEASPIQTAKPNTRIAVCDDTLTIARRAQYEYGLKNEKEAITKLLRFGLGELSYRWQDELREIAEVDEASVITSSYLHTDDFTQSLLSETSKVDIPARQPAQQRSNQVRVLWYENHTASELCSMLSIPKTDILRCGILVAGEELGNVGDIPSPQLEKVEKSLAKFDKQIQRQVERTEQLVFGAITKAADSEQTEEIINEIGTKCPHLWEHYCSSHNEINSAIG